MAVNTTARDIPRMTPANLWENRIAAESIAGVAITEVATIPNGPAGISSQSQPLLSRQWRRLSCVLFSFPIRLKIYDGCQKNTQQDLGAANERDVYVRIVLKQSSHRYRSSGKRGKAAKGRRWIECAMIGKSAGPDRIQQTEKKSVLRNR